VGYMHNNQCIDCNIGAKMQPLCAPTSHEEQDSRPVQPGTEQFRFALKTSDTISEK